MNELGINAVLTLILLVITEDWEGHGDLTNCSM